MQASSVNNLQDTIKSSIRDNIYDVLEHISHAKDTDVGQVPQVPQQAPSSGPSTQDQQSTELVGIPSLFAQDARRSSRRRNISFYQQHIYTIDSVSYILKISLGDATELVKQRPEIINMYRQNHLERYLKNGFKLPEKVPKEKHSDVQNATSRNNSEAEDGYSSVSSNEVISNETESQTESDSDTEFGNGIPEPKTFKFRGRFYKDLNAVSRASGLPKSYFSKDTTAQKVSKVSHKRNASGPKIGVAKRKKGAGIQNEFYARDVFTVDNDSQENPLTGSSTPIEKEIQNRDVIEIEPDPHSSITNNQVINFPNDIDGNAQLDDYNDVIIVSERDNPHARDHELSMFNSTENGHNMFYRAVPMNLEDEAEVAESEIEPMLTSTRRNPGQKNQSSSRRPKHSSDVLAISKHRSNLYTKRGKRFKKSTGSSSLRRNSRPQIRDNINHKIELTSQPISRHNAKVAKQLTNDPHVRKSKPTVFFITPGPENILPRNAGASTVVYEGLSEKLSLMGHSHESTLGEDVSPGSLVEAKNDKIDGGLIVDHDFKASNIYKILCCDNKSCIKSEVKINLGPKSFIFSKLLGDSVEHLGAFFKALLDPLVMRLNWKLIVQSIDAVLSFCLTLNIDEVRSLVVMVDNFKLNVENNIRTKGHVKDIEFYYLSICTLVYNICFRILDQNHIHGYSFQEKSTSTICLYFEFACHVGGQILCEKLHELGYFRNSMEILSLKFNDGFEDALDNLVVNDMKYIESVYSFTSKSRSLWKPVMRVFKIHLEQRNMSFLKEDIKYILRFSTIFGWSLNEDVLCLVYEAVKINRFSNFPGEHSFPVIFSEFGINKDTSINIYLNLLMSYSNQSTKPTSKFLEKIIPVSKNHSMDITTFCNRVNIMLCLAMVFKKNFEPRIDELILGCDRKQSSITRKLLKVIEIGVKINQKNCFVSRVRSLGPTFHSCLETKDTDAVKHFFESLNIKSLRVETQKNMLKVVSNFKKEKVLLKICEPWIRDFVLNIEKKEDFEFLKTYFADLNSSISPSLWCHLNGVLVSQDLANWSRLINFNQFDDEPFVYSYILRHSGQRLYQIEKETIIISLLKSLTGKRYSSSLNSFIREVEKVDPKLVNSKGVLIQTHKFQICTELISNICQTEPFAVTTRILSTLVKFIYTESQTSRVNNEVHYIAYAKKVIQFIFTTAADYLNNQSELANLADYFGVHNKKIIYKPSLSTTDILLSFERYIIDSIRNRKPIDATFFKGKLFEASTSTHRDLSSSSLYDVCCLISIHAELIQRVPSCWSLLSEISGSLAVLLQHTRNFSKMDIFCLAKTVNIFLWIFSNKHRSYQKDQYRTCINFIRIVSCFLDVLEGTNDYFVIYDLVFGFISRNPFVENDFSEIDCSFLIKPPHAVYEMLSKLHLDSDESITLDAIREKFDEEYQKLKKKLNIDDLTLNNVSDFGYVEFEENYIV